MRYVGAFGPAARTGLFRVHLTLRTPDGEDYAYSPALSYEGCQGLMRTLAEAPWNGVRVVAARIAGPVQPVIGGDG